MSDLRHDSATNRHLDPRPDRHSENPASAWLMAGIAMTIILAVTLFSGGPPRQQEVTTTRHAIATDMPQFLGHPPR